MGSIRQEQPLLSKYRMPLTTVGVDDLDESFSRGLELGGTVAVPKMPIPGFGWLEYMKDTEANVFGMMRPDPGAQ